MNVSFVVYSFRRTRALTTCQCLQTQRGFPNIDVNCDVNVLLLEQWLPTDVEWHEQDLF